MYSNESYLIELLTQAGYLNEEILQYARSQKSPTQDLVDFLIQANYLTEDVIAQVAASNSGLAPSPSLVPALPFLFTRVRIL